MTEKSMQIAGNLQEMMEKLGSEQITAGWLLKNLEGVAVSYAFGENQTVQLALQPPYQAVLVVAFREWSEDDSGIEFSETMRKP